MKWYYAAAIQGDDQACQNLGMMHERGEGTPRDFDGAAHFFLLAAERNFAPAQFSLALLLTVGQHPCPFFATLHSQLSTVMYILVWLVYTGMW